MIKLAWAVTCLVVWAGVSQVSVGVRLENGRYEDVVLAVDPAMGTDVISITDLEKKVKTLLQATSDSLHAATEGRLSLGSVRVVLPQTWNAPDDLLEDPVEGVSWGSADIRLEEPEKDYRGNYVSHTPHTLQPGQCGVPGRHITIHTTLLDADYAEANYGSQGAVMAHEWAHFRWGVMEEHGFPGDGVFPVHYSRGGQDELPTSCFAGDLEGKFETEKGEACDPGAASPACYFLPSGSSTNGSLMYLTHLSDGHFCKRNTHNPWAPTPQNVHCGRRSVWEVLETHDDFTQTSGSHATPAQVAVTFHKPQTPRIFLLFDPPLSEESAAIISDLVKSKIQDLSRKFQSFDVGMATCRLVGENVELIKKREFSPVADVNSLDDFMPAVSDRESNKTVPLGRAVAQLVPTWTDHTPGTLLMALVYNHVSGEEAAAVDSEILLKKKVKMLLLDGLGNLENLPTMAPLLQETGGRIYSSSNATANIIYLQDDFERYFSSSHLDDHIVYGVSTTEIKNGITTVGKIQLDAQGLSYLNLVIKIDSFDPEKFNVILTHPVLFRDVACGSEDAEKFNFFCGNFDGGIYASFQTTGIAGSDVGYEFKVSSTSQQSHAATVTWSTVEDIDNPMVHVDLWSSEDRGFKAVIPESAGLRLFCEVVHPQGYLEGLTIAAEVTINSVEPFVVTFVDEELGEIDTRRSDSIWTAIIPGDYPAGSELIVTKLAINHNPDIYSPLSTGNTVESQREVAAAAGGSAAASGSAALPTDPWEGPCCGSYHEGRPFSDLPINRFLRFPYKTVLARDVKESPPKVVGLEPAENSEQQLVGNIVKVAFKWGGAAETRTARTNPDSYMIRYSTDLYGLIDDFQSAKEPLEGTGTAPGSATEAVVSLPYAELVTREVYLSVAAEREGVVGPPATAVAVTINENPTATAVTTTIVSTTSTTTTTTASTTTTLFSVVMAAFLTLR